MLADEHAKIHTSIYHKTVPQRQKTHFALSPSVRFSKWVSLFRMNPSRRLYRFQSSEEETSKSTENGRGSSRRLSIIHTFPLFARAYF